MLVKQPVYTAHTGEQRQQRVWIHITRRELWDKITKEVCDLECSLPYVRAEAGYTHVAVADLNAYLDYLYPSFYYASYYTTDRAVSRFFGRAWHFVTSNDISPFTNRRTVYIGLKKMSKKASLNFLLRLAQIKAVREKLDREGFTGYVYDNLPAVRDIVERFTPTDDEVYLDALLYALELKPVYFTVSRTRKRKKYTAL